jgi:MscS family membrane protein
VVLKELMNDLHKMLKEHPDVDPHNTIIVNLDAFGAYSLDIIVQADLKALDSPGFARAKDSILFEIARLIENHKADFATYCPSCYSTSNPAVK